MKIHFSKIALLSLLVFHFVFGLFLSAENTETYDEHRHLLRGYMETELGDFRLATDHPPLANSLVAIPLSFQEVKFDKSSQYYLEPNKDILAKEFLDGWNYENKREVLASTRAVTSLFLIGIDILLFMFLRDLFGEKTAFFGLILTILEPNLLAHGTIVTTDIAVTFFAFLNFYWLCFFLKKKNLENSDIVLTAILYSLGSLTKHSFVLFAPIWFVAYLFKFRKIEKIKKKILTVGKVILVTVGMFLLTISVFYRFESGVAWDTWSKKDKADFEYNLKNQSDSVIDLGNYLAKEFRTPFSYYMKGFIDNGFGSFTGATRQRDYYLMGDYSQEGHKLFFVVSFLFKTPIFLVSIFLTTIFLKVKSRKFTLFDKVSLGIVLFIYIFSSLGKVNFGIRHVLIVQPIIIAFSAQIFSLALGKAKKVLYVGVLFTFFSLLFNFPYFVSYTNEALTPENRYKVFNDSNLNWGQDLDRLYEYLDRKDDGSEYIRYYIGDPIGRKLIISSNDLAGWGGERGEITKIFRETEPEEVLFGGTYFLFDFGEEKTREINQL